MPKKSYMDKDNILNESYFKSIQSLHEGFIEQFSKFLKGFPPLHGGTKKQIRKKLDAKVKDLNKDLDDLEKLHNKVLGPGKSKLPRFTSDDFIRTK
tara:strand:+ start:1042 stop:1329 length:288 start_codon:yes stop_codon:yes gene_type:complete